MAIFIDYNVYQSDNAKELKFVETTGAYNAVSNTGGWGAPNELVGDATLVELKITPPGGSEVTIDISTNFPTTDNAIEKTLRSQDLGLGTDVGLPDGIWDFKYEVTTPSQGLIVNCQNILISGGARCCVYNMLADAEIHDCDGSDLRRALEAFTYYRSALACAAAGHTDKFTELLALIANYCNKTC